jgi:hypothetical protein
MSGASTRRSGSRAGALPSPTAWYGVFGNLAAPRRVGSGVFEEPKRQKRAPELGASPPIARPAGPHVTGATAISSVSAVPHTVLDLAAAQADVFEHVIVHCLQLPHAAAEAQLMGDRGNEPRQATRRGRQRCLEERGLALARRVERMVETSYMAASILSARRISAATGCASFARPTPSCTPAPRCARAEPSRSATTSTRSPGRRCSLRSGSRAQSRRRSCASWTTSAT